MPQPAAAGSRASGRSLRRAAAEVSAGNPVGAGACVRGICDLVAEPVSHSPAEISPPTTPMLRQYHEAKAQARDALLFFRLGDFYELFYDDARTAAEVLGITLPSRAKGDERVPMAGVPHHSARGYIARLVAAGHKVAICDQMEVPGPGTKLVKREIVRLVTPGTLVDEEVLEASDRAGSAGAAPSALAGGAGGLGGPRGAGAARRIDRRSPNPAARPFCFR